MQATMQKTGFKGTMPEFITFLRTDPQFYAKTPHELLADAAYVLEEGRRQAQATRSASCRAVATA